MYLLDTDTASYLIKNRSPRLRQKLAQTDPAEVGISAVTSAELLYGLTRLPPAHRLHLIVREFLRLSQVVGWGGQAPEYYAQIRRQLTGSGQLIGELDMMIAAHSMALAATLVTNNVQHFARIQAPLRLENWSQAQCP